MHPSVDLSVLEKKDSSSRHSPNSYEIKQQLIDNNRVKGEKPAALLENNIIPENIQKANQPLLPIDSRTQESSLGDLAVNQSNNVAVYSELDQLIQQNSPISSQTAPILLPTDLLFEYDADQLKADAEKSLKKLALLIQRNPKAQFIVEGFTDSFGSDEYNFDLSTRRANTIKQWLITKEHINPVQIQSYGLGKTHFIVPSNGTIQQQSLNRRVEIVIRQNKNPQKEEEDECNTQKK
jgi:outer membrane protein OmpA-like peptidoglycan-associated protein